MSLNYRRLDYASNEIRVIQLLACPGDRTSSTAPPVRCRLKHVTPKTCPKYYALSYVWGRPEDVGELEVWYTSESGLEEQWKTVTVQKSLETALKHIRRDDCSVVIWADALCIDQSHNEEKSIQVQKMKWIYESAYEILIWLGPAADGSDELLATLVEIGEHIREVQWKDGLFLDVFHQASHIWNSSYKGEPRNPTEWFVYRICGRIPGKRVPSIAAYVALLKRPWWTRTWVILEYASRRDGYFVCGASKISTHRLLCVTNVYSALKHALDRQSFTPSLNLGPYETEMMLCQSDDFENFDLLHATCVWAKTQSFVAAATFYRVKWPHQYQCSNLRDHVYALAGLTNDGLLLRPDYTKSVEEVFLETSAAVLQHGQLDILTFCQRDRKFSSLPSWVIDWTANVTTSPIFTSAKYSFAPYFCARERIRPPSISRATISNNTVHISGMCIGTVALAGSTMPELARSSRTEPSSDFWISPELIRRWLQEFWALLPRSGANVSEAPHQRLSKVVSAIFGDIYQFKTGITEDVLTRGLTALFTKDDHEADGELMKLLTWSFYGCLSSGGERPFVTRDGRLGIASENVEQGDSVVHFPGASLPSVIRSLGTEYVQIVGPAQLEGYMSGEAFTGKIEAQMFRIR